jgi:hypothetical protein
MHMIENNNIQEYSGKTLRKETAWKTYKKDEENIKIGVKRDNKRGCGLDSYGSE